MNGTSSFDVVVIGSGAAGLVAALTAAHAAARVLVVEKTPWLGGTTALSEGMVWIPLNAHARARGLADSVGAAVDYLRAAAPASFAEARAQAYCACAADALEFVEAQSPVRYELADASIDYHPELPGATAGTRALRPLPYDARHLRADFAMLRPPLPTTLAWGGMMLSSGDHAHVLAMRRSVRSSAHVASLALRYMRDRALGSPRGTRLTNGNAVIAGLWTALRALHVPVWTNASAVALSTAGTRVVGVDVATPNLVRVEARSVVLACGGFPGSAPWTRRHVRHVAAGKPHVSLAPKTNTGDGLDLALSVGARLASTVAHPLAWTPASEVPQADGSSIPFPHYVDRAKPGVIAVTIAGVRFANEAMAYQRFVPAMIEATRGTPVGHVWLVADHRAVRNYGLGAAPPAPGRLGPFLRSGYLVSAASVDALAARLGIDPTALGRTIRRFNEDAVLGRDREFGKGDAPLDRAYGDPAVTPNPCLAPLEHGPYYAIRLVPGDIGSFVGLDVDANARVLRDAGVIEGLYAAGNDVCSPTGGEYPAAGVTVGAAMTFGYLAGRHATLR